jgi:hypothetical protein
VTDISIDKLAHIYTESGVQKPPRKGGGKPMWESDHVFQEVQGGHNMVLQTKFESKNVNDPAVDIRHVILTNHGYDHLRFRRVEHRQVFLKSWLDPYIKLIEQEPAAMLFYDEGTQGHLPCPSPIYDLYGSQLQMLVYYQGAMIHNYKKWWEHKQNNDLEKVWDINVGPMSHYLQDTTQSDPELQHAVIDRIEQQGWEMVHRGVFDAETRGDGSPGAHPDFLWSWSDTKQDWESDTANPKKLHTVNSDKNKEEGLFNNSWTTGAAAIFGPDIGTTARKELTQSSGDPYHKNDRTYSTGHYKGRMPVGRAFAKIFETAEHKEESAKL